MKHHPVRILDAPPEAVSWTSRRRARKAVRLGLADWVIEDVSIRFYRASEASTSRLVSRPALPAPLWVRCWRTAEAAVLQPYQPFQRGVAL